LIETIGALRGICDGKWIRSIGGDGGKRMIWRGRIGFIGACTPKIDAQHNVIQELGQRWLYYRYDTTDGFGEAQKSLTNQDREKMSGELCELIAGFVAMQGLEWDMAGRRELSQGEMNRLIAMASLIVRARSRSTRDWRTKEVVDIDEPEAPSRMASALGQLYLGLETIGLENEYCWRIVCKMAWDSCPRLSTSVLRVLSDGMIQQREIREVGGLMCSQGTVERTVQDLEIFGVAKTVGGLAGLTDWALEQYKVGWQVKL
jgi:hypothetical protein